MKRTLIILITALAFTACAQTNEEQHLYQESKQEIMEETTQNNNQELSNAEDVIKALITAMEANDAVKIRSLFNENASQAYGDGPAKSGKAFFSWLESDIISRNGHVENANFAVNGNEVVVTGQYSSKGYTNKANFLFSVKDGQIMSWQMRY